MVKCCKDQKDLHSLEDMMVIRYIQLDIHSIRDSTLI